MPLNKTIPPISTLLLWALPLWLMATPKIQSPQDASQECPCIALWEGKYTDKDMMSGAPPVIDQAQNALNKFECVFVHNPSDFYTIKTEAIHEDIEKDIFFSFSASIVKRTDHSEKRECHAMAIKGDGHIIGQAISEVPFEDIKLGDEIPMNSSIRNCTRYLKSRQCQFNHIE